MATSGDSSVWGDFFPDDLLPDVILLILSAWDTMQPPPADEIEIAITERLVVVLKNNKLGRRLPFTIHRESWLDEMGRPKGRLDIRFQHGYREEVYLAFECKRLNVNYPSGFQSEAGAYIDDGMRRFVDGTYSFAQRHGGMIAYVMNGDIEGALASVETLFPSRQAAILLNAPRFVDSTVLAARPNVRETTHRLPPNVLQIHHCFLSVVASPN